MSRSNFLKKENNIYLSNSGEAKVVGDEELVALLEDGNMAPNSGFFKTPFFYLDHHFYYDGMNFNRTPKYKSKDDVIRYIDKDGVVHEGTVARLKPIIKSDNGSCKVAIKVLVFFNYPSSDSGVSTGYRVLDIHISASMRSIYLDFIKQARKEMLLPDFKISPNSEMYEPEWSKEDKRMGKKKPDAFFKWQFELLTRQEKESFLSEEMLEILESVSTSLEGEILEGISSED